MPVEGKMPDLRIVCINEIKAMGLQIRKDMSW